MYVQKLRDLEDGGVDLRIPNDFGENGPSEIALSRIINSHSEGTILYNYSRVKKRLSGGKKHR